VLFLPLVALVAAVTVLGLSMGRKAALTTESEVIEAVAARYLDEGGAGFLNDAPVARIFRDAKLMEIGAGTSEIRRMLVGRELMGAMG